MKYRFDSAIVLNIIIQNNILLKFYQNDGYYLFYVEDLNLEHFQEAPKNIELMVKPILLNQFIFNVSTPKFIVFTETQSKQIDLLFNIFRSL